MNYRWGIVYLNLWRIIPIYYIVWFSKFFEKIQQDNNIWTKKNPGNNKKIKLLNFGYNLMNTKEFRNLLLNRLHRNPFIFLITRIFFRPLESLYINMPPEKIGGGLYLQHGFSTIIAAKEIGENCNINQQVTIGYNGEEAPIIKSNVTICAGAIVIGKVVIEKGAIVGAGAVVKSDVSENTVVAGVPAKVIKNFN